MADPIQRICLDVRKHPSFCGACDIFELPSGKILAAFNVSQVIDTGEGEIFGKIADDYEGKKWPVEPFPILTLPTEQASDRKNDIVSVRNPTLLRLKNGKVGLIYMATRRMVAGQNEPQQGDLFIRTLEPNLLPDTDNWSPRIDITEKSKRGEGLYGLTHSAAAVLADGSLLVAPWYQLHDNSDQAPAESEGILVFISQDDGATWSMTTDTPIVITVPTEPSHFPPTEAKVTQLSDGSVLMSIRPPCADAVTARAVYLSYSKFGNIFSPPEPRPELPSPSAPNVVRQLPGTSDLLVIWNNCVPCPTARSDDKIETAALPRNWLSSALLRHNGKTWANHKVIDSGLDDQGQLFEIAYPSCTFIRNKAYISYYKTAMNPTQGTPTSLELVVVPPEWFSEP